MRYSITSYFNPRSDERSDIFCGFTHSIIAYFNPRSDERSDYIVGISQSKNKLFQSTLRRTERPCKPCHQNSCTNFNPRSDERSDLSSNLVPTISIYFNPRSDERSDFYLFLRMGYICHFNPRSDERSDCNFAQKNEKNYTKPLNNIIVFY